MGSACIQQRPSLELCSDQNEVISLRHTVVESVNGEWDVICSITGNRQSEPMHAACADLTVMNVRAGHWLPLERKAELIQAIRTWLQSKNL